MRPLRYSVYLFKLLACTLDTSLQHVPMGRHASGRVKHSEKMATAVSDRGREFLKGEVRFEPAFNELLYPKQALLREHRRST